MENQLQTIVQQSGLEKNKADFILKQFQDYFKIAAEWEDKAKTIIVTDASQKSEMEMARVGRLFLREKRIAVEKARKNLKEQALREGKAIDGIANVLKALIVPIEEYLDKQEHCHELISIEEEHRNQKTSVPTEYQPRVHAIIASSSKTKDKKAKSVFKSKSKPKAKIQKKNGNKPCWWTCGQVVHWAKECPQKFRSIPTKPIH